MLDEESARLSDWISVLIAQSSDGSIEKHLHVITLVRLASSETKTDGPRFHNVRHTLKL